MRKASCKDIDQTYFKDLSEQSKHGEKLEVRIKVNLRQVWDLPDRGTGEQERSDAGRALLVPKHQAAHKVIMVMVMVMVVIMNIINRCTFFKTGPFGAAKMANISNGDDDDDGGDYHPHHPHHQQSTHICRVAQSLLSATIKPPTQVFQYTVSHSFPLDSSSFFSHFLQNLKTSAIFH